MKKKYLAVVLTVLFSLSLATLAIAETPFSVITGKDDPTKDYGSLADGASTVPPDILEMPVTDEWTETLSLVTVDAETGDTIELTYPVNPYLLPINTINDMINDMTPSTKPVLVEDTLFLPLREIAETWHWTIEWHEADKSIILKSTPQSLGNGNNDHYKEIYLKVGQKSMTSHRYKLQDNEPPQLIESYTAELITPPCLINGTAMVSMEFMYEAFNCIGNYYYPNQSVQFSFIHQLSGPPR